jgi:hypothetical protein
MAKLVKGSVVTYKDDYYVALEYNGATVKIIAPHVSQTKRSVKKSNLKLVDAPPLTLVKYRDAEYLVSVKGSIISLTTNRVMNWKEDNGDRKTILALAEVQS